MFFDQKTVVSISSRSSALDQGLLHLEAEGGAVAAEVAGYDCDFAVGGDERYCGESEDEGSGGKVAASSYSL
jgi:hypothetical protein